MAFFPVARRRALLTGATLSALLAPGLAGLAPAAAQDAGGPVTAQAAPEDTVVFLSLDTEADSAQWTQAQELLSRMGLPNALDDLRSETLADPANRGDVTEADLDALLGGEVGFVVLPRAVENLRGFAEAAIDVTESGVLATPGAREDDEAVEEAFGEAFATPLAELGDEGYGLAMVLEPSDLDQAWNYVERQMADAAAQAGTDVEEIDYDGTTILVAPIPEMHGGGMAMAGIDDAFGMATPAAGDAGTTEDELDAMGGVEEDADETVGGEPTEAEFGGDGTPVADEGLGLGLESESIEFEGPSEIAAARAGDFIVAAATADDLEPLIDAATGDAPSLAESDDLAAVRAELDTDEQLLFGYFDGPSLWENLGEEVTDRLDDLNALYGYGPEWAAYREAHEGIVVWADDPGLRVDTVILRTDGEPLPELVPDAEEVDFAERVPANTIVYTAGTFAEEALDALAASIAQSINQGMAGEMAEPQTIEEIFAMFTPEYQEAQLAEAENVLGFNLRDDFTDLLSGEYGLGIGAPQMGGSAFGIDLIVALGTTDPDALSETVQRIARQVEGAAGGALSARQEGEDTVYVIQDPNATGVPAFEFGVVDDEFLAGTDTGIESYQQGPAEPLADDEQFETVMGLLPEDGYQEAYVNLGQIIELALAFTGTGAMGATQDADISCAEYADQDEAQAALEEDPLENAALDSDFDGEACEDFFGATGTPVAAGGPQNVRALGIVAWEREGKQGSSTLLYVADEAS